MHMHMHMHIHMHTTDNNPHTLHAHHPLHPLQGGDCTYLNAWVPDVSRRGRGFCVHKRDPHHEEAEEGGGWHKEGDREICDKEEVHRRDMHAQGREWCPHTGEGKSGTSEHTHAHAHAGSEDPWPELRKIFVWQAQAAVEADMEARKLGTGSLWGSSVAHQVTGFPSMSLPCPILPLYSHYIPTILPLYSHYTPIIIPPTGTAHFHPLAAGRYNYNSNHAHCPSSLLPSLFRNTIPIIHNYPGSIYSHQGPGCQ